MCNIFNSDLLRSLKCVTFLILFFLKMHNIFKIRGLINWLFQFFPTKYISVLKYLKNTER